VRKPRLGEVIFWYKNLNLERLFAEDRLAAAYNARNRAALQEAAAASNGGKKFSKSLIRKHEFWLCRNFMLKKKFNYYEVKFLRHMQAPYLWGLSRAQALT
jgi:hypothetical protein